MSTGTKDDYFCPGTTSGTHCSSTSRHWKISETRDVSGIDVYLARPPGRQGPPRAGRNVWVRLWGLKNNGAESCENTDIALLPGFDHCFDQRHYGATRRSKYGRVCMQMVGEAHSRDTCGASERQRHCQAWMTIHGIISMHPGSGREGQQHVDPPTSPSLDTRLMLRDARRPGGMITPWHVRRSIAKVLA